MDFTMLRQICRRGRLVGFINDYINTDGPLGTALKVLFPDSAIALIEPPMTRHYKTAKANGFLLTCTNPFCPT